MEGQDILNHLQLERFEDHNIIFWQWQSDADPWKEKDPTKWTWQNYPNDFSLIIEQAFSLNRDAVDLPDYQLDLKKMLQVSKKDKSKIRRVRRQVQGRTPIESKLIPKEQKTMSEAFGTVQHFLEYIMNRTPEAFTLYKRLKTLSLDSKSHQLADIMKQVAISIERGAEAREKIIKSRTGAKTTNFILEAKKIVDGIQGNSLRDFLKVILKIYTMESFICYWLNELLRGEDWEEMNVLTPYLVCLLYTFRHSEYTMKYSKPKNFINNLWELVSKKTLCLYRGTVLSKEHLDLYNLNRTKYFSWNGVTSTSRNKNVALNFVHLSLANCTNPQKFGVIFLIEVNFASSKDSEGMIDVSHDSQYPDEQEIILAPGTVFKLQKICKLKNDFYEIRLRVARKFNKKEETALLGTLHCDAIQHDSAVLENLSENFKLLELLKGNKMIKKLEIKNSLLNEYILKEIEIMRATTNVRKQDIKLYSNIIAASNINQLIDCFSLENLSKTCEMNEIQFTEGTYNDKSSIKNNISSPTLKIFFSGGALEKLRRENQWKPLWARLKNESQIKTLDLSLQELWASNNELRDVTDFIQGLKCLENLKLIFNKYQTKQIKVLWEAIGPSSTLKKLDLELNRAENGLNFNQIKSAFASLISLRHLSLHLREFTMISDQDFHHLKDGLLSLKSLQYLSLDFSDCEVVSDEGLNYLKNGIIPLTSLQHLALGFSNCRSISDKGLSSLKESLLFLTSLQQLSLNFSGCREISDEGLYELKDGLEPLIDLQYFSLDFSNCQNVSSEGLIYLKTGLESLTFLQNLSLNFSHCNMISDGGLNYLHNGIKALKLLQNLFLDFSNCCQISDEGLSSLKDGFIPLTSLKDLTLEFDSCKKITIGGVNHIKEGLYFLKSLQNLKIFLTDCPKIPRDKKDRLESEFRSFPSAPYTLIL